MCFQFLPLILKVGKIFAITPSSTKIEKLTIRQYIHSFTILILLLVSVVSQFIFCCFCLFPPAKQAILVLMEFTLYFQNMSAILSNLFNRQKFCKMMDNLKTGTAINSKTKTCLQFLLPHMLFWIINIYVQCRFTAIWGSDNIVANFVWLTFQLYFYLIFTLYVYGVLEFILANYEDLQVQVVNKTFQEDSLKSEQFVYVLNESVHLWNDLFGWPLFFQIFYTALATVNCTHNVILFQNVQMDLDFIGILINLLILVPTLVLLFMCGRILKIAKNTLLLIYKSSLTIEDDYERRKIQEFGNFFQNNFPKFTAANFFEVNMSTILSIFGSALTFLIVLLEFDDKVDEKQLFPTNFSMS